MATFLKAKAPTEVVERRWTVPVDTDDAPASVALIASGITVDSSEFQSNELVLTLSGGSAAATGTVVATVTTDQSRVLVETLYVPIIASAAQTADTARDYCEFALRKIVGVGNDAEASELDDALEQLDALIAAWRKGGADIGAAFPLTANTVIYCPDWAASALRYNLRLSVYSLYSEQPTEMDAAQARRGLQLIKHSNLSAIRTADYS